MCSENIIATNAATVTVNAVCSLFSGRKSALRFREGSRDALCQLKSCQLLHYYTNSAEL